TGVEFVCGKRIEYVNTEHRLKSKIKKAPKVGLVARRGVESLSAAADMNPVLKEVWKDMFFDPVPSFA
ncbi:hypothetical protein, partial [Cecembia rubra]|uniref:hypothetical protein n=1 Tax=Cecembia rubra TaxID=1485585 RepID=UPI00271460E8